MAADFCPLDKFLIVVYHTRWNHVPVLSTLLNVGNFTHNSTSATKGVSLESKHHT